MAKAPATLTGKVNIGSSVFSCYESANTALGHIQEWAKWMAGIQAAAIGGLGAIVLKSGDVLPAGADRLPALGDSQPWAIAAFVFLALALLFSAWVLSALGSVALRLGIHAQTPKDVDDVLDIYNWPSFTWWPGRMRLGLLMGLQHWSWAFGLACLGVFCLRYFWCR